MSKKGLHIRRGDVRAGKPAPDPYAYPIESESLPDAHAPAPPRPPLAPPDLLRADVAVFDRKQADYAPALDGSFTVACDTYENFRFSAIFADRACRGLAPDDPRRSIAVLLGVKISRLMTLGIGGTAKNESVDDTHSDLRVYDSLLDGFSRLVR